MNAQVRRAVGGTAAVLGLIVLAETAMAGWLEEVTDAQIVASRISDEPIAPQAIVDQVEADLAAIREEYPQVASIRALRWWHPGYIEVSGVDEGGTTAEQGVASAATLAFTYGVRNFRLEETWAWFEFQDPYTPRIIGPEFGAIEGISWWSGYRAMDGSDIESTELGRYTFIQRWGDCPLGCTDEQYWEFEVEAGVVTLVNAVPTNSESTGRLKSHYIRD